MIDAAKVMSILYGTSFSEHVRQKIKMRIIQELGDRRDLVGMSQSPYESAGRAAGS